MNYPPKRLYLAAALFVTSFSYPSHAAAVFLQPATLSAMEFGGDNPFTHNGGFWTSLVDPSLAGTLRDIVASFGFDSATDPLGGVTFFDQRNEDSSSRDLIRLSYGRAYAPFLFDGEQTSRPAFEIDHTVANQINLLNFAPVFGLQNSSSDLLDSHRDIPFFPLVPTGVGLALLAAAGVTWKLVTSANARSARRKPRLRDHSHSPNVAQALIEELRHFRAVQSNFAEAKSSPPKCRRFLRYRRYAAEGRFRRNRGRTDARFTSH